MKTVQLLLILGTLWLMLACLHPDRSASRWASGFGVAAIVSGAFVLATKKPWK